jgi:hypothetical protein
MAENQNVPGRSTPPRTPAWVKVFLIVILLLIAIVWGAHLLGIQLDHGGGAALFDIFAYYTSTL